MPAAPTARRPVPAAALVPTELVTEVEHALSLLAPHGDRGHDFLDVVGAAVPAVNRFPDLLRDAELVLLGDDAAASRYNDSVDAIGATDPPDTGDGSAVRVLHEVLATRDGGVAERLADLAAADRLVSSDREAVLVLAALQAAEQGDRERGVWRAAVLHEQLCRYEVLAALHRCALQVLAGHDAAPARMRALLASIGAPGGPIGPRPPLEPPVLTWHPWPPFHGFDVCVLLAVHALGRQENRYLISGVAPARACAGEQITIAGSGFGTAPGTVRFRRRGGEPDAAPLDVAASSWTDTQVVVTVPRDAGWGVRLVIPVGQWQACGRVGTLHKQGQFLADFAGSAPDVVLFRVAGVSADEGAPGAVTVEPSLVTATWDVRAADTVSVSVLGDGGVLLAGTLSAPSAGSLTYDARAVAETTRLRVHLRASGTCSPPVVDRDVHVTVQRPPDLQVHGIEVTQAIQYYRAAAHLTDPADRGPDNSVRLVADKAALVRVYVRSGQDPGFDHGDLPDVTGTLEVRRVLGPTASVPLATLLPTPSGARVTAHADPLYDLERGDLRETLDFVVPAGLIFGRLRLSAEVTSAAAPIGGGPAHRTVDVDASLRQTLRVAAILLRYDGPPDVTSPPLTPKLVLPSPAVASVHSTLAFTLAAFPVAAQADVRIATTLTQTRSLQDPVTPGSCSPAWDQLMHELRDAADDDGNQPGWVYFGLLPGGVPVGPVAGCGGDGVGVCREGEQETMAEEIGHALGLPHAPCGNPFGPDPDYPAYEPYDAPGVPTARTGEYGYDAVTQQMLPPSSADIMSYCGPAWLSLRNHARLIGAPMLSPMVLTSAGAPPQPSGAGRRHAVEARPLVVVRASAGPDDDVDVVSVRRVVTRPFPASAGGTGLVAELLGEGGDVLARGPLVRVRSAAQCACADACSCRDLLVAYLPDVGRGSRLRIRRGRDELWSRDAPAQPLAVGDVAARLDGDRLTVRWSTTGGDDRATRASVSWSADAGRTWHGLVSGLPGGEAVVDVNHVPGGDVELQVAVQDGFDAAAASAGSITMPHRPPVAVVLHPGDGDRLPAARTLRLWGAPVDVAGRRLAPEAGAWTLDGAPVAGGPDVVVDMPAPGTHVLAFTVRDEHGVSTIERTIVVEHEAPDEP